MTFADIAENFIYNPLDFSLRLQHLNEVQQLLYEMYNAMLLGKVSQFLSAPKPALPVALSKETALNLKRKHAYTRGAHVNKALYNWILQEQLWCGWLTIDSYYKKEKVAVQNLLSSRLNLLWLELCPELYLSKFSVKKRM